MGWSAPEMMCMKHPSHNQQPGVCSCCLNEKLSKLSGGPAIFNSSSNNHQFSSPSNISSPANYHYYSSGSSSSPSNSRGRHHRTTSDVLNSFILSGDGKGGGGLKKSRSIAVTVRGRGGGGGVVRDGANGKKKKQGFWSKLIKSTTGKRTKEGYVHPRMKDRFV